MTATVGIPTKFDGTQFRSRLEARWAAFFETLGWGYIYEPFDADGYIPDFVITRPRVTPLLVEVKPATTHAEYLAEAKRVLERTKDHWQHDFIILGVNPYYENPWNTTAGYYFGADSRRNATAVWWVRQTGPNHDHIYLKPAFTRSGTVSGSRCGTNWLDKHWRESGNKVQWKSPGTKEPMSTAERTQARIRRAQEKKDG
jgi:hypothetical protein